MNSKSIRVAAIINNNETSAAAIRAQQLFQGLETTFEVRFFYNQTSRWRSLAGFTKTLLTYRPQLIYMSGTSLAGALAVLVTFLPLKTKIILDTGDAGYELAQSVGAGNLVQLQLVRIVEQAILRVSHQIIVRGTFHKTWLERRGFKRVAYLPDGVDCDLFRPLTDKTSLGSLDQLRKRLGLEDCLVVGTVGSSVWSDKLQMAYGWDLVDALAFLKDLPVKALMIVRGSGVAHLRERAEELGVSANLCLIEGVPHAELPLYLNLMNICTSTQTNNIVGKVRTTGKLPEYMATRRFILATDVGEASLVLKPFGMLLPYLSEAKDTSYPNRLAERIRQLYFDQTNLTLADQLPALAKIQFEYKVLREKFVKLLANVAQPLARN